MGRFTRPAFLSAIVISSVLAFAGISLSQSQIRRSAAGAITVTQTSVVSADAQTRTVTAFPHQSDLANSLRKE